MKTSQIVFLGLALFLTVCTVRSHHREGHICGGLGAGTNPCSCGEFLVRAAKQSKPLLYASPSAINEAAAARAAVVGPAGCDGGLHQARNLEGGLSVKDLLTLEPHARVAPKLSPVGDLCSVTSHRSSVLPAYPGKPRCSACLTAARNSEGALQMAESLAAANAGAFGAQRSFNALNSNLNSFDEDDGMSFDEQESIYNGNAVPIAPADAVSLSLAYGLARKVAKIIPEDKLAFGPRTLPADGHIKQTIPDIPEERLFAVDKPIVELKAVPRAYGSRPCSTLEEDLAEQEALEQQRLELEAEAQAHEQSGPSGFISYSDLGYAPVGPSSNNFVSTQPTSHSGTSEVLGFHGDGSSACGPLGLPVPGYRSGVVITENDESNDYNGAYGNGGSYRENSHEQDGSYSAEDEDDEEQSSGILAKLRSAARKMHHNHQHGSSCGCGCRQ